MSRAKGVWVVERGCYSDYHVLGVFSTEDNAQKIADMVNVGEVYDKATVAQWPLDPGVKEIAAGLKQWRIIMLRDGTVEKVWLQDFSEYDMAGDVYLWQRTKAPAYRDKGIPDALRVLTWARDEKHAVKIANEIRTQKIAAGEWP